jgi:uncharacterized membrane protein
VHKILKKRGNHQGLVCIFSAMEGCSSYKPWHDKPSGRTLLLALDLLVAADIILTVALDLSFEALGMLGLLVLIRTFLHFILELEISGRWPWQGAHGAADDPEE